jgi:hypothetical protein
MFIMFKLLCHKQFNNTSNEVMRSYEVGEEI